MADIVLQSLDNELVASGLLGDCGRIGRHELLDCFVWER